MLSRHRDNGNTASTRVSDDENGWASFRDTSLDTYEALELLTLGERWSPGRRDSQLIGIRAALRGGASWEQTAEALGVPADFARKVSTRPSPSDWTPQPQPATWPARPVR